MKNLFNNISQEEKNTILEMHSGKQNVISEQPVPAPSPQGISGNQYRQPPYCKVGESQGKIVTAQTSKSGPDISLGETGFALSVNGKEICLISTKHTKGGYVTKASQSSTPQPTQGTRPTPQATQGTRPTSQPGPNLSRQ
jgi:hypothetical protein